MVPLFKLGTLAVRTISKPIANRLKAEAGLHPRFREYIIGLAQANYRFTTNLQRRLYGRATDVVIRPLDEAKAVGAAAEFLGELVIFSVAGLAVLYEVNRSARSEARKEEQRKQEIEGLKKRGTDLEKEVQCLKVKLQEMEQLVQGRSWLDFFKFWHAQAMLQDQKPAMSCDFLHTDAASKL
ncbi:hypothetical protein TB2_007590 [Malus domestica]